MKKDNEVIPRGHLNSITSALTRDFVRTLIRDNEHFKEILREGLMEFNDFGNYPACVKLIKDLQVRFAENELLDA